MGHFPKKQDNPHPSLTGHGGIVNHFFTGNWESWDYSGSLDLGEA
jgi:hypothetical protein